RNFYLGIQDFECHYAHYPPGSFYKKHVDRHKNGSPRRVSSVLYLNTDWLEQDGGELRIYSDEEAFRTILPQLGTLALFLSELEHEVITTSRDRMSITGWMLNEKLF
ncbi:MAG: 2OG-Fe(II) oxygenase, partial [Flavobacteriales bacterium]